MPRFNSLLPLLPLLALCLLASCNFQAQHKDAAEQFAAKHYGLMQKKDYATAMTHYSPEFFTTTSRERWQLALPKTIEEMGELKSFKLTGWRTGKVAGVTYPEKRGHCVTLVYKVQYEKQCSKEDLILFKAANDRDFKILRHKIERSSPVTRQTAEKRRI